MKFENKSQLVSAIREDIIGELQAINQYERHAQMTDDPSAKAIWEGIRDEEKVHVGELLTLWGYLEPNDVKLLAKGEKEATEIIQRTR